MADPLTDGTVVCRLLHYLDPTNDQVPHASYSQPMTNAAAAAEVVSAQIILIPCGQITQLEHPERRAKAVQGVRRSTEYLALVLSSIHTHACSGNEGVRVGLRAVARGCKGHSRALRNNRGEQIYASEVNEK